MENNTTFEELGLEPALKKAIYNMGFQQPTEVQTEVVPIALGSSDLIVQAQTGTGKTTAFGIPMMEKLSPTEKNVQALVLTPTRELAVQVAAELSKLGRYKGLRAIPVYGGGQSVEAQKKVLSQRIHIIVGTPGRILDHVRKANIDFAYLRILVLDEADEMLNLGLIEEVRALLDTLPSARQTMMFSATLSNAVEEIAKQYTISPRHVYITPQRLIAKNIAQWCFLTEERNKESLLLDLLGKTEPKSALIFCQTRRKVEQVVRFLKEAGLNALGLRGDLPQKQRLETLQRFKNGECKLLIATDVAARGLDIKRVALVVNYDMPQYPENYVHRIGRTGRANNAGTAIVFCTEQEFEYLKKIEEYIGQSVQRKDVSGGTYSDILLQNTGPADCLAMDVDQREQAACEITRLFIGAGRKHKLRAGDIVGAITGQTGISGEMIGVIEIYDTYSFVDILENEGDRVLDKLQNGLIKGRRVKVSKAKNGDC